MKFKFDCVYYYVRDLKRSISFYTDILGFTLRSCDMVARLYVNDVLFELVPVLDESKLDGNGNARLCLEVSDIRRALKELRGKRVSVGKIQDVGQGKLASIYDPDNNELVLWQYTP